MLVVVHTKNLCCKNKQRERISAKFKDKNNDLVETLLSIN